MVYVVDYHIVARLKGEMCSRFLHIFDWFLMVFSCRDYFIVPHFVPSIYPSMLLAEKGSSYIKTYWTMHCADL